MKRPIDDMNLDEKTKLLTDAELAAGMVKPTEKDKQAIGKAAAALLPVLTPEEEREEREFEANFTAEDDELGPGF